MLTARCHVKDRVVYPFYEELNTDSLTHTLVSITSSTVGIGSRQQDLFGEDEINLRTSLVVRWRKSTRRRDDSAIGKGMWGWMGARPASSATESRLEWMPESLVSKKLASSVAAAASVY